MSTGEFIGVTIALSLALFLSAVAFFKMTTDPVGTDTRGVTSFDTAQNGLLIGSVFLSPVCPVESIPPDPSCAPRGFATKVNLRPAAGGNMIVVPTGADGTFSVTLPAGSYEIAAVGGNPYPLCAPERIFVSERVPTSVSLFCDTGIR